MSMIVDVVDLKLPRKRKLPDFHYSQSSDARFYDDHPKKKLSSLIF